MFFWYRHKERVIALAFLAAFASALVLPIVYFQPELPTFAPRVHEEVSPQPEAAVPEIRPEPERPLPSPPVVPTSRRFEEVVARTLVHEGGELYTNHPADPGGPTKWGITIHDVRRFINPKATANDVKALTYTEAINIYRRGYWDAVKADKLPPGLDYVVFDYAVGAGVSRALFALQRAYDEVAADDVTELIWKVSRDRMFFQMGLSEKYNVFKIGWRRRIIAVREVALREVAKQHASTHLIVRPSIGKTPSHLEETL